MRNLFFGAFCGVLVFAGLSLWTARRSAAVLASPPAGRFDIVQLHPNTDTEWLWDSGTRRRDALGFSVRITLTIPR